MGTWLCIDPGTRRIGVAAGDIDTRIASPVETVPAEPRLDAIRRIGQLVSSYNAIGLVVGWPLNMDDTEGPQAIHARALATELADALEMDVRMWDERLSSFTADQALAGQLTRKKRRARQDSLAAATILQDFLNADGPRIARRADSEESQ
jgi:putative pre-16S rRNA nuclease